MTTVHTTSDDVGFATKSSKNKGSNMLKSLLTIGFVFNTICGGAEALSPIECSLFILCLLCQLVQRNAVLLQVISINYQVLPALIAGILAAYKYRLVKRNAKLLQVFSTNYRALPALIAILGTATLLAQVVQRNAMLLPVH